MGRRLLAVAAVAAGGALGATARWMLLVVFPVVDGRLPVTILVENLGGAFTLGVVAAVLAARFPQALLLQAFLTTGLIGSFTTFSTMSIDIVELADAGLGVIAVAYGAASVCGGLVAALAGLGVGRRVAARREPMPGVRSRRARSDGSSSGGTRSGGEPSPRARRRG